MGCFLGITGNFAGFFVSGGLQGNLQFKWRPLGPLFLCVLDGGEGGLPSSMIFCLCFYKKKDKE